MTQSIHSQAATRTAKAVAIAYDRDAPGRFAAASLTTLIISVLIVLLLGAVWMRLT